MDVEMDDTKVSEPERIFSLPPAGGSKVEKVYKKLLKRICPGERVCVGTNTQSENTEYGFVIRGGVNVLDRALEWLPDRVGGYPVLIQMEGYWNIPLRHFRLNKNWERSKLL